MPLCVEMLSEGVGVVIFDANIIFDEILREAVREFLEKDEND